MVRIDLVQFISTKKEGGIMCRRSFLYLMVIVAMCILVPGNGFSGGKDKEWKGNWEKHHKLTGIFYEVEGLKYKTQTGSGITDEIGEFKYREGETVTFFVGKLVLGSAPGGKLLTEAHLVPAVAGDVKMIKNQVVTNMARFVQSLDEDDNVENGVAIHPQTARVVSRYKNAISFDQSEEDFTTDPNVVALFEELNLTLRTPAQARNHLRRTLYGIHKSTDVKIPTRDGSYLLGDIYRPIKEGKYPPIVAVGAYGKPFGAGCICGEPDLLAKEVAEDRYFEGNPDNVAWENGETINTLDWVPQGYVKVIVDDRGICNSPGTFEQFSLQEAKDYYDVIEWAGVQPWSNGQVGTWGVSYWSMDTMNMAQLQPPHLKAIMPLHNSSNSIRDYMFNGGIWNFFNFMAGSCCVDGVKYGTASGKCNAVQWPGFAQAHPFDDPAYWGPTGSYCISPDLSKVTAPMYDAMPLEHPGIHIRGSSESFIRSGTPLQDKKLDVLTGALAYPYTAENLTLHRAFFDYWLKDIDNGAMDSPAVRMMLRTGHREYVWRYATDWPVPGTQYANYYLSATPSSFVEPGKRQNFMQISTVAPTVEASGTYKAEAITGDPCWASGVSFVSEPLSEDLALAGYIKLVTWVSSTSSDMDIMAYVRVMDETGTEVPYGLVISAIDAPPGVPVALGWLKVSHRKTDPAKSTIYRPWHTHKQADYAPLTSSSEVVPVEVEIWPTTAMIKQGWRIRLDVQPVDGCDAYRHIIDPTYHTGAFNTIYTGPDHISYLQLPVIPPNHHEYHGHHWDDEHHGHDRD